MKQLFTWLLHTSSNCSDTQPTYRVSTHEITKPTTQIKYVGGVNATQN